MNGSLSIISFIVAVISAYLCYRIAQRKGRGTVLWPIVGFIFPLLGLIVVALLPRKAPTY